MFLLQVVRQRASDWTLRISAVEKRGKKPSAPVCPITASRRDFSQEKCTPTGTWASEEETSDKFLYFSSKIFRLHSNAFAIYDIYSSL